MRYASIRSMDISNGEGVGVALFVQGCHFRCYSCFNQETWNFDGGKEWTEDTKNKFIELINHPYISRVSFLGGEPLADENVGTVFKIIEEIRSIYPDKKIWLYTGYVWEYIFRGTSSYISKDSATNFKRKETIKLCNIVVDGQFINSQKNMNLRFKGSSNQRVIDVQKSLEQNKVILHK